MRSRLEIEIQTRRAKIRRHKSGQNAPSKRSSSRPTNGSGAPPGVRPAVFRNSWNQVSQELQEPAECAPISQRHTSRLCGTPCSLPIAVEGHNIDFAVAEGHCRRG